MLAVRRLGSAALVVGIVVGGTPCLAHAQGVPQTESNASAATDRASPADGVTAEAPPFWVAGVVITSARRSAMLVLLDDKRREVGVVTLREGESHSGYRVATVEPDRVLFERNGNMIPVVVGRPYAGPRGTSDPLSRPRFFFVPGPDKPTTELEYSGPQRRAAPDVGVLAAPSENAPDTEVIQNLLERVFSSPQLQEKIPQMRPTMQELERVQQDRLPDVSAHGVNAPSPGR